MHHPVAEMEVSHRDRCPQRHSDPSASDRTTGAHIPWNSPWLCLWMPGMWRRISHQAGCIEAALQGRPSSCTWPVPVRTGMQGFPTSGNASRQKPYDGLGAPVPINGISYMRGLPMMPIFPSGPMGLLGMRRPRRRRCQIGAATPPLCARSSSGDVLEAPLPGFHALVYGPDGRVTAPPGHRQVDRPRARSRAYSGWWTRSGTGPLLPNTRLTFGQSWGASVDSGLYLRE